MDILNTLGMVTRLTLLLLSAYLVNRTYTIPVGNIKLPPFGPSFPEKREWVLARHALYACPLLRGRYVTATFFDCLLTFTTYLDNPAYYVFLSKYLPLPAGTSDDQSPGYISLFALLMGVVGGFLRISCYRILGDGHTLDVSPSPKLVTSGPYSLVRHPSYLGLWLTATGVTVYHLSPGSWVRESDILKHNAWAAVVSSWVIAVAVGAISAALRTEDEDRLMKKMFREEWESWRKVVRYKILPGLF